ncbi:MAG TPA: RagB/SusD family nutrient uptake outer membrane protein, partial [Bacteroidales bacterium]|nr:RagB/SusD family nutrient uptake outer membrane protein [Bacteroidales bacterium]
MKKQYLWFVLLFSMVIASSCEKELEQIPLSTASKAAVFGSQHGLEMYVNSFYTILPGRKTNLDAMSDYLAVRTVPIFIQEGAFAATLSSEWTWTDLRNLNYFIVNCKDPAVDIDVRKNYLGIAKFFRAYFYFEKIKR